MIDGIDLNILKILQKKARIPNVAVARQVDMAPSAVLERIRKLEKRGFIDGYEVRLNPKRFRRNLVAFVMVATKHPKQRNKTAQQLSAITETQEVHEVAGEDGILVKIRVADTAELGRLLKEKIAAIDAVRSTRTMIVMSTLKESARIPIDDIDIR
ncbi:MAG: Lrp/AsnC family transcriptional regulator [Deltaproteobacteria bacterium]|nr:Lrp/AsnC family transcriptional regulator [Deltaproteobacteria bacterium]MBW2296698.1 Lrp/AsnC family transcriptional regulator [Deltaproteobacteria bacterium]MBW2677373.1 Lrp/AsnC family transcriptional regulator [Deltaproteobacteria bacterium]